MADINIQRKKSAPSPWLLVLLALALLAIGAYFFLRHDPNEEPTVAPVGTVADTTAAPNPEVPLPKADPATPSADEQTGLEAASPEALRQHSATNPAAPDYARRGLQLLTSALVSLADREDLRDPTIAEQRNNLTSATSRLDEPNARLRPGFVAAASLVRAMQQKAYPTMESAADSLVQQAGQLSGRSTMPAEQQQTQQFLVDAAAAIRTLNEPASN